jgi:hypothetical protein
MPVKPPIINKKRNPITHKVKLLNITILPYIVETHEKILIPVGIAIIIVAAEK